MHSLFTAYLVGSLFGLLLTIIWVGLVYGCPALFRKLHSNDEKIKQLQSDTEETKELSKIAEAKVLNFKIGENYHAN